ncbi:hypothetical protein Pfo_001841 [Paulownia fortunei]|nr:hypothetical protein Pfo_001841 [Paulownia fortunei]
MGSLSGFRPPQFSEDDAWLPAWLQQCNVERLNAEGINKDHITFEQRVEEFQFLRKGISNGESLREEGGCDIGQLFISGTDSSSSSFPQSADNVVQFHLCLSSDGISENTTLTTDACQTESNCPFVIQPLENSGILGQKDVKLSLFCNAGAVNLSPTMQLERPVNKNELLKYDENVNSSEAAADAVELCIAASEALVINEVIESDSFAKSSTSAILEASLQVKQARLEVWKNTFSGSIHVISEVDNLSDLDDITMESAHEDVGIHLNELPGNELPGNELSVSQVKDTFDSEYDENLKHEKASASAKICVKSCDCSYTHRMEGVIDNDIQLRKDLATECLDGDTRKRVIGNPVCGLGTDVGYHNDCLKTVDAQAELCLSVSAKKANATTEENNSRETNVSFSPITSCRDGEKDYNLPNVVQEQFESRWFGGWTSNNEVKYTTVKHSIPEPFAGETSFLSESADVAPDENSFVQNHDKGAIIASQLSIPTENLSNRAKDGMLLSQDVRSSSTSLVDPLCSVVPCSISENICSSPAINHEDTDLPGHFNSTTECKKDNVLGIFPSNNVLAQGERIAMPIATIKESRNGVSRRFTSLRDYSKLLPSRTKFFKKDSHQKNSFLIDSNTELTFQENRKETVKSGAELPVLKKENSPTLSLLVNHRTQRHFQVPNCSIHNLAKENPIQTAPPESKSRCLPSENLQLALLQCKNQSAKKLPASKRVHFSEKETNILDNKKLRKVQTASKTCCSTRASTKSTRSSAHLASRAQQMDKFLKNHLDKEKKRLIFQNMEFLLTGFSQQKEKEIEGLIRKYGGIVLSQLPSTNLKEKRSSRFTSRVLPIVLCLKKIQSFKFLYGCAVNAYVLKVNWLIDSIADGFVLPPKKYMILSRNISRTHDQVYTAVNYNTHSLVFNNLGIMLHGKTKYFTNIATIIKHGGGQVFKTLQRLVQTLEAERISMGVVVADEESCASRHLKHCALEQNIPMTSVYWIIKSLYAGQLISLEEKKNSLCLPAIKLQRCQYSMELSQEI